MNTPLRKLAEATLRDSGYSVLCNVVCDDQDGRLTLRGRLPSHYLKQMAQHLVATLDGTHVVINQIEVATRFRAQAPDEWAAVERKPTNGRNAR